MNKTTEAQEPSRFKLVEHFVGRERRYSKALELACSYLTDEQAKEIADAMPPPEELAEPVKHESVMDYEHICALRESEQIQAGDSYFFVRPENDTPTSRKMFCQGFERGFHKGLKYAAPVSAKREWVDLTDDEIVMLYAESPMCDSEMIEFAREVITAFKEKNT